MGDVFEFEAPQFVDFNSGLDDSDEADKFFDVEEETPRKDENKENNYCNSSANEESPSSAPVDTRSSNIGRLTRNDVKSVLKTPKTDDQSGNTNIKRREIIKATRRLSEVKTETNISQDIAKKPSIEDNLSEDLKNISFKRGKRAHFEGIEIKTDHGKEHGMVTRNDEKIKTPKIELRTRSVVKNGNPIKNLKRKSVYVDEIKPAHKYISLAETILHFQKDTPPRFHTHSRKSSGVSGNLLKKRQSYKPRRTIALTPKLMSSLRSRPVEAPSQEQREEMELEEMKKHQIKANPLNEKIFLPPKLPPKQEIPKTAAAPFNLTQVAKKSAQKVKEEPFRFTANPVPRAILEKPVGIAPKRELPITVPESPAITKPAWACKRVRVPAVTNHFQESTEDLTSFGVPLPYKLKRTEVKPFSFEIRDKQMLENKEKKIKEILETEKKMREFKAKPVPSFIASSHDSPISSVKSSRHADNTEEELPKPFKARSPRVLKKEPFRVVKEHVHSEPLNIQLHSDRRAMERQQFEMKKAEKEEEIAGLRILRELRMKQEEEAEIARLRREAVHKAQPMPNFKPVPLNVKVHSTQPLTDPQSPKFTKRTRTTTLCSSNLKK